MDFPYVVIGLIHCITLTALILLYGPLLTYLSQLFNRLSFTNQLASRLLENMHEGVYFFTKENRKAICYNESATKLIETFLGSMATDCQSILEQLAFAPQKFFLDDKGLHANESVHSDVSMVSLE